MIDVMNSTMDMVGEGTIAMDNLVEGNESSRCLTAGEEEECGMCKLLDYWVEGPTMLIICVAGILGGHSLDMARLAGTTNYHRKQRPL